MRRTVVGVVSALMLLAVLAPPATSQISTDLITLGLEIDPTQGRPGDTVTAQLDVDDIARDCHTVESLAANFIGELGPSIYEWRDANLPLTNHQAAFVNVHEAVVLGAAGAGGPEAQAEVFNGTHILTFVEVATQDLIGSTSSFDPATGAGTVDVPTGSADVPEPDPGFYGVVGTCVEFPARDTMTSQEILDLVDAAYAAWEEYVLENDLELPPSGGGTADLLEFASETAPYSLGELLGPRALGISVFCVNDESGEFCNPPAPPVTVTTTTAPVTTIAPIQPATPISVAPRFTG